MAVAGYEGFGLGLALGDVNKDGYHDVYVSNDYISIDLLYINQRDGTFKNEIASLMSYQTKSSMGNDMADINNDGYPDMFTLDMFPEYYYKKKQTIKGFGYIYYINDEKYSYEHQYLRNMLHLHNGILDDQVIPYSEVSQMMGIYHSEWSWSPLFADYDNDGDLDYMTNNLNDVAFVYRNTTVERGEKEANYLRIRLHGDTLNPEAFGAKIELWNKGDYQFQEHFLSRD